MEIVLGRGRAGFRQGGKHLVLTHGVHDRVKRFRLVNKVIGQEVVIVAVIKSKSKSKQESMS